MSTSWQTELFEDRQAAEEAAELLRSEGWEARVLSLRGRYFEVLAERRYQFRCKRCNEPHAEEMNEYCEACIEAEYGSFK